MSKFSAGKVDSPNPPVEKTLQAFHKILNWGYWGIECTQYFSNAAPYLNYFVVCLTDEKRLVLFPVGTTVRGPHHGEPPTHRKQDFLNEVVQ